MTRDDYIDLYFAELDLGPRYVLRDKVGAPSPADEQAARSARAAADAASAEQAAPVAPIVPVDSQKKAGNATLPAAGPAPADQSRLPPQRSSPARTMSERSGSGIAMPAPTGRAGSGAPVPVGDLQDLDWDGLETSIRACSACGLCRQRRQAVPGVGDRRAEWLFIGEGPGAEEDNTGEPFVGPAGKLLDNMLLAIGLKRGENVFIANAVKCRPPNNRAPEPAEMATCRPYLERQIALLQPKLIVLLGRAAAHAVLGSDEQLGSMRGRLHRYQDIPVLVTYHPAYLLRTLLDKAKAWEDLCLARRTMREIKGD